MYIATDLSQLKTEEEVKKFMDDLCKYLDTNPKKLDFEELLSIRETYINHPMLILLKKYTTTLILL
jgi:hypothetical protein